MALIGSQVARGLEGTGEAVIFDKGISPESVLLQEVADKKARDKKKAEVDAETWKSLENYRADGWYNDDVALKKKQAELKDFYAESFSKGINPESVDPKNPASIAAYRKGQKLKDELAAGNASSKQMKEYFDRSSIQINTNPNAYTSQSKEKLANYYKLPLAERMGVPPPTLDKNAPKLDWYTAITKIKPPTLDVSIERGVKTVKDKGFNEKSAELGWNEFKGTSLGLSMIDDKGGSEDAARQTYMNIQRSLTPVSHGEFFDEPRTTTGRKTFDLEIQTIPAAALKDYANVKKGDVAGKEGLSVEVPGIWKGIEFKGIDPVLGTDKTYDGEVIRIKTDKLGNPIAIMSIDKGKGETQQFEVPYDDQMKTKLRNALKSDDIRSEYDDFNKKLDKSFKKPKDVKFNDELVNDYINVVKTVMSSKSLTPSVGSAGDENQIAESTAAIQDVFNELGIKRKIELVKSASLYGSGVLKIEGEAEFDMDDKDDIKRLREFIADQGSGKLTTVEGKEVVEENKESIEPTDTSPDETRTYTTDEEAKIKKVMKDHKVSREIAITNLVASKIIRE